MAGCRGIDPTAVSRGKRLTSIGTGPLHDRLAAALMPMVLSCCGKQPLASRSVERLAGLRQSEVYLPASYAHACKRQRGILLIVARM